jgi:hypothetical protein
MQRVFAYAPMARSMGPMFSEEGFHLGAGRKILKELAVLAIDGKGEFSTADLQAHFNQWLPRGLEMFGSEAGGGTVVDFGFKDRVNGVAQSQYYEEVRSIIDQINLAVALRVMGGTDVPKAKELVREVVTNDTPKDGLRPEYLLTLPDRKFFRRRGNEEIVFKPYSVRGDLLTSEGKPLGFDATLDYLKKNLPPRYLHTNEFLKFVEAMKKFYADAGDESAKAADGGAPANN